MIRKMEKDTMQDLLLGLEEFLLFKQSGQLNKERKYFQIIR